MAHSNYDCHRDISIIVYNVLLMYIAIFKLYILNRQRVIKQASSIFSLILISLFCILD
jgi:hypothetical protein